MPETPQAGTAISEDVPRLPTPRRLSLVLVLGSLTALGPLTIDLYLPALPQVSADLHISQTVTQLALTAFMIGIAVGQLVLGPLSDTLGRRRPLLTGLTVYVAASAVCALAPDPAVLISRMPSRRAASAPRAGSGWRAPATTDRHRRR
ncbi:MFS transporter [Streptomyces sp. DT199]|uniref:MFS transporter n=1 Tax=Streptomyces TaxID=1883 RepID=UPI0037217ECB